MVHVGGGITEMVRMHSTALTLKVAIYLEEEPFPVTHIERAAIYDQ